jgi:hypothetical protein
MDQNKNLKGKMTVKGNEIAVLSDGTEDYISLTDIARFKSPEAGKIVENWIRSRVVIEYLGLWETLNNPDFKLLEFEDFRKDVARRPLPPEGPRRFREPRFSRCRARAYIHACACDGIINSGRLTIEYSRSMQMGAGWDKR